MNSPLEQLTYRDRILYIKRDDLISPYFSGNKARKFHTLLYGDASYKHIISYGGVQSNAMHSLSFLALQKKINFTYLLKAIPSFLKNNPSGNYLSALKNGVNFIELGYEDFYEKVNSYKNSILKDEIFITQGGYEPWAEDGIKILAKELEVDIKNNSIKNPILLLSSGTGTTALYLAKNIDIPIYTTPCVGDEEYLKAQFFGLESGLKNYPKIINTSDKFTFGKLHTKLYEKYLELLALGLEIDLLYDSKLFIALDEHMRYFCDNEIIFIHSGGISGNETMLERYKSRILSKKGEFGYNNRLK